MHLIVGSGRHSEYLEASLSTLHLGEQGKQLRSIFRFRDLGLFRLTSSTLTVTARCPRVPVRDREVYRLEYVADIDSEGFSNPFLRRDGVGHGAVQDDTAAIHLGS